MPILTFAAADDVTPRIAQVRQAAINSVKVMREVLDGEADALHALRRLKFDELGHNPLGPDRWNVIEQLNQTFTYLVSLAGARWLLAKHPDPRLVSLSQPIAERIQRKAPSRAYSDRLRRSGTGIFDLSGVQYQSKGDPALRRGICDHSSGWRSVSFGRPVVRHEIQSRPAFRIAFQRRILQRAAWSTAW